MPPDDQFSELRSTLSEVSMPSLTVNVDFNMLMADHGLIEALEILGKLKDLLQP